MTWQEIAAWKLAEELETIRAKAACGKTRRDSGQQWWSFYDPHAATELASLIYNRMTKKPKARTA